MTERIDHAGEAIRLMDEIAQMDPIADFTAIAHKSLLVTSHIGLASVEQQRIANLIALAHPIKLPSGGEVTHMLHDPVSGAIREDVAEGLRL